MQVRFHIDPDTTLPHIFGHGVTKAEAEYVLSHPSEDRRSDEDSRIAVGQTEAGRFLRVIYAPDEIGDGVFVITAYDVRGKQLKALRRRQKRKGLWNPIIPRVGI